MQLEELRMQHAAVELEDEFGGLGSNRQHGMLLRGARLSQSRIIGVEPQGLKDGSPAAGTNGEKTRRPEA
jgi:hypothetical protein